MYKQSILVTALMTAACSTAFAADMQIPLVTPPAYQAAGFDWSGFYAGVVGGYSWGRVETVETGVTSSIVDPAGGLFGVTAGYNAQFDQFVLGAEGELLWSGVDGSAPDLRSPTTTVSSTSDWQGALKLRAGVAVDRILFYAHGGLAFVDLNSDVVTAGVLDYDYHTMRTGFIIGAGVEAAVTDAVSVKAEYAYTNFGTWVGTYNGVALPGSFDVDQSYAAHSIKAGINFHF